MHAHRERRGHHDPRGRRDHSHHCGRHDRGYLHHCGRHDRGRRDWYQLVARLASVHLYPDGFLTDLLGPHN